MIRLPESHASPKPARRLFGAMTGQARKTPRCPDTPRLDGRLALVTGATGGIGFEIARGLAARGAALILPCRNPDKGERVRDALRAEHRDAEVTLVEMDLEDLDSVHRAAAESLRAAAGRPLHVLVENAGIWPRRYAETRQGFEIAFGVNVLAHFALRRDLLRRGLLEGARVVVLTGDIYILESRCTADSQWNGAVGGMRAYCRSKLGNLWIAAELRRRHPELQVFVVHPGVVATNLGGKAGALGDRLKRWVMISPELGAQTALICATQDGLENGGYYHNSLGLMRLADGDPARNAEGATRLWEACEALA